MATLWYMAITLAFAAIPIQTHLFNATINSANFGIITQIDTDSNPISAPSFGEHVELLSTYTIHVNESRHEGVDSINLCAVMNDTHFYMLDMSVGLTDTGSPITPLGNGTYKWLVPVAPPGRYALLPINTNNTYGISPFFWLGGPENEPTAIWPGAVLPATSPAATASLPSGASNSTTFQTSLPAVSATGSPTSSPVGSLSPPSPKSTSVGLIGGVVGGVLGGMVIALAAALLFLIRRRRYQPGSTGNLAKDMKRNSPELDKLSSPKPPAELHSPHTGAELPNYQSSQEEPDIESRRVWDESPVLGSFEIASLNGHTRNYG